VLSLEAVTYSWLGHPIVKIIPEMTYKVSSGSLSLYSLTTLSLFCYWLGLRLVVVLGRCLLPQVAYVQNCIHGNSPPNNLGLLFRGIQKFVVILRTTIPNYENARYVFSLLLFWLAYRFSVRSSYTYIRSYVHCSSPLGGSQLVPTSPR